MRPKKLLIDTDVLIDYLRGRPQAVEFLESLRELHLSDFEPKALSDDCRYYGSLSKRFLVYNYSSKRSGDSPAAAADGSQLSVKVLPIQAIRTL